MSAEKDLSTHSCVVVLGLIGTLVGIVVGCIAIFTFVTGRPSLLGAPNQPGVIEAAPM